MQTNSDFIIPTIDRSVYLMNSENFAADKRFVMIYARTIPKRDTPVTVNVVIQNVRFVEGSTLVARAGTQVESYIKHNLPAPDGDISWEKFDADDLLLALKHGLLVVHLDRVDRLYVPRVLSHTRLTAHNTFTSTGHMLSGSFATFLANQARDYLTENGHYVPKTS